MGPLEEEIEALFVGTGGGWRAHYAVEEDLIAPRAMDGPRTLEDMS